jgi:hypothetical protein
MTQSRTTGRPGVRLLETLAFQVAGQTTFQQNFIELPTEPWRHKSSRLPASCPARAVVGLFRRVSLCVRQMSCQCGVDCPRSRPAEGSVNRYQFIILGVTAVGPEGRCSGSDGGWRWPAFSHASATALASSDFELDPAVHRIRWPVPWRDRPESTWKYGGGKV